MRHQGQTITKVSASTNSYVCLRKRRQESRKLYTRYTEAGRTSTKSLICVFVYRSLIHTHFFKVAPIVQRRLR